MSQVTEQQLIEAIRRIPQEQWGKVLHSLNSWPPASPITDKTSIRVGTDLAGSDLIGIWSNRDDIQDSQQFARSLREQAQRREASTNAD